MFNESDFCCWSNPDLDWATALILDGDSEHVANAGMKKGLFGGKHPICELIR